MKKPGYLTRIFICLISLFTYGDICAEKYPFTTYSVDDGLPDATITAIYQDREGYLWFGTRGGVSRFDGRNFVNYSARDGMKDNDVMDLFQDTDGNMWVLTIHGVSRFDGENWIMMRDRQGLLNQVFLSGAPDSRGGVWLNSDKNLIRLVDDSLEVLDVKKFGVSGYSRLMLDKAGNLWVGTNDGILKYDGADWTMYREEILHEEVVGGIKVKTAGIMSIYEDSQGNLWFGFYGGLVRFDGTGWKIFYLEEKYKNSFECISEDNQGNLWLGSAYPSFILGLGTGAVVFDGVNAFSNTTENGLPQNRVSALFRDREGNLWIGTEGGGVCKFSGTKFTTFTTADGLVADEVNDSELSNSIFEDSKGNIWCLFEKGISRFDGNKWVSYTEPPLQRFYSAFEDSRGALWFGCDGGWVHKYDGKRFTSFPKEKTGLYFDIVSIIEDDQGNLWFSSQHHSVGKYDGKRWTNLLEEGKSPGNKATVSLKDSRGNLWFGNSITSNWQLWLPMMMRELGVTRYDGENWITYGADGIGIYNGNQGFDFYSRDSVITYKTSPEPPYFKQYASRPRGVECEEVENYFKDLKKGDGFDGYWVRNIYEDGKGRIWFAFGCGGLSMYDGQSWKTYRENNGLAFNNFQSICEDGQGNLWIANVDEGISRFDGEKFTNFSTKNGLSNDICKYIFQDGGYIYIGTSNGLNRFDGEKFKLYTQRDGLGSSVLNFSYLKDSQGKLWFGTQKGITRFDPSPEKPDTVPPPVKINRLRIFDQDTTVKSGLELDYRQNNLRIDYVGLCFTSPETVIYSLMLEGLDKDWRETAEHSVSYVNLQPGEYTFKIKARNNDGFWSLKPAELSFAILPPFWATAWFRGSAAVGLLGILWGLHALRIRYLRKRNIEMEHEIAARKKVEDALRKEHAEVESLKSRLEEEKIYLEEEIKIEHGFEEIIGSSESLKRVLLGVEQVAATDATVLILGETGTGKELIARAIHSLSPRSERTLVKVNCAALPANLIESELFGHEKGAFTGAHKLKIGRFELAHGGSIFLDEIAELPHELQAKLLRVLQDGEFERLGDPRTFKVDVRVIAASNRDLEQQVRQGLFREDLFYRLNVYPIRCPALREHREDIPLLVNHFVNKYCTKTGRKTKMVSQGLISTLQAYHWPGNVRELQNVIERAVIVSRGQRLELSEWLPYSGDSNGDSAFPPLEELEREHIIKVLESTGWRVSGEKGAARILEINPKTLQSRMRKLGIHRKQ
jgi:DNA-binding NtrC family response regulator/ligand-binding sensor domain-containing protein